MAKYVVRYGSMRQLGVMNSRPEGLRRGDRVVARTPRGIELGEVLCEATEDALSHLDEPTHGQVLRLFSEDDAAQAATQAAQSNEIYKTCRQRIAEEGLDMKLVDVEQVLGGDRVVVYYVSEDRVDFRNLVKLLATDLKTRIEMRQIGVRDEAKLLADYGDCGKPVCCNTHLSKMPPVSMKMAKLQKATLDPNKISGRCGRLKCCLRYEYDTYEAIIKEMPNVGSEIVTRDGKARVLAQEILSEQLLVETEDMRRTMIHSSEVLSVTRRGSNRQARSAGRRPPVDRSPDGNDARGERGGRAGGGRRDAPGAPPAPRDDKPDRRAGLDPLEDTAVADELKRDDRPAPSDRDTSRGSDRPSAPVHGPRDGANAPAKPDSASEPSTGSEAAGDDESVDREARRPNRRRRGSRGKGRGRQGEPPSGDRPAGSNDEASQRGTSDSAGADSSESGDSSDSTRGEE